MSQYSFVKRESANLPGLSHASSYYGETGKTASSAGDAPLSTVDEKGVVSTPTTEPVNTKSQGGFASAYRSFSWMMGFRDKYSLIWFFTFGGALLGFCLGRSTLMSPSRARVETTAGEYFWFNQPRFGVNYLIHIWLTIIGGILVGLQFLPGIRRRAVILHRINGYTVLLCLIAGNICGAIVARRAYGGDLNIQMPYYLEALMIVFSGLVGIYNVKRQTRRHRAWMLRMTAYFCAPITTKVLMMVSKYVISQIGTYYSVWRCDEMLFVVKDRVNATRLYPTCFADGVDLSRHAIAVHASMHEGKLNGASAVRVTQGMSLWLGLLFHTVGVEIYLRLTEQSNQNRYGYVLEAKDYDGEANGEELWVYNRQ